MLFYHKPLKREVLVYSVIHLWLSCGATCLHWYVYSVSYLMQAGGRLYGYVNSVGYLREVGVCLHWYVNYVRKLRQDGGYLSAT